MFKQLEINHLGQNGLKWQLIMIEILLLVYQVTEELNTI